MTPVPQGVISTSTGPVDPSQEIVQEVVPVEEATPELVEEVLPEVEDEDVKVAE